MRPLALITGVVLVAFGTFATFGGDIAASWWWLVAIACAVVGLTGLVNVFRVPGQALDSTSGAADGV